ncbi:outer membrane protein [Hyphomicrobium sp. 99]|uniref:outer membrane protein n=1 Tax=Hyphomicrobium sp. 99 TaxID=1163419 RepID=UPI0005F79FC6|nr:outer membrane beta-barrel protein [Hyphomicrobium sp. 99]
MIKPFAVLAALGALVFAVSDAHAGGSLKDEPAAPIAQAGRCMGGNFSGAYMGVHLGGGSARTHESLPDAEGVPPLNDNDRSFTIGEHSGYNVQCGRVVFGIESEFNYFGTDLKTGVAGDGCGGSCYLAAGSSMNFFGTVRGRLGIVRDENLLIFATAGLAYAKVKHSFATNIGPDSIELDSAFSQSNTDYQFGWTAGGGFEFMRDGNWSLRGDALYVDLGSDTRNYTLDTCGADCSTRVKFDDSFWVVRLGLTYHFGRREAEVVPLK